MSEVLGRQVRETAMATPRWANLDCPVVADEYTGVRFAGQAPILCTHNEMRRPKADTQDGWHSMVKLKGAKSDLNKATRLGHRVLQQLNFQRPASSGELTSQAIEGLRKFDRYCDHCYHMVSDYLLHNLWQSCFSYPAFAALFKVESL